MHKLGQSGGGTSIKWYAWRVKSNRVIPNVSRRSKMTHWMRCNNGLRSALLQRYFEEDDMQRIGCYPMDHSMMLCCNSRVSKQMQDDTLAAVQRIGWYAMDHSYRSPQRKQQLPHIAPPGESVPKTLVIICLHIFFVSNIVGTFVGCSTWKYMQIEDLEKSPNLAFTLHCRIELRSNAKILKMSLLNHIFSISCLIVDVYWMYPVADLNKTKAGRHWKQGLPQARWVDALRNPRSHHLHFFVICQ